MSAATTTTPAARAAAKAGARNTSRRVRGPMDSRRADLAQIHQLAKDLHLQEDAYRDLMATVCGGVRSAALLDVSGRQRFINHLRRCLGKPDQVLGKAAKARDINRPLQAKERLLWALWMQLASAGAVEHRTMTALSAYAQRQTGVARVEWLNDAQKDAVIHSLKLWIKRLEKEDQR